MAMPIPRVAPDGRFDRAPSRPIELNAQQGSLDLGCLNFLQAFVKRLWFYGTVTVECSDRQQSSDMRVWSVTNRQCCALCTTQ
jgi:hypothetical protein